MSRFALGPQEETAANSGPFRKPREDGGSHSGRDPLWGLLGSPSAHPASPWRWPPGFGSALASRSLSPSACSFGCAQFAKSRKIWWIGLSRSSILRAESEFHTCTLRLAGVFASTCHSHSPDDTASLFQQCLRMKRRRYSEVARPVGSVRWRAFPMRVMSGVRASALMASDFGAVEVSGPPCYLCKTRTQCACVHVARAPHRTPPPPSGTARTVVVAYLTDVPSGGGGELEARAGNFDGRVTERRSSSFEPLSSSSTHSGSLSLESVVLDGVVSC